MRSEKRQIGEPVHIRPSRAARWFAAICFILAAIAFTEILTTLIIGVIAVALYQVIYRRNPRVIALLISMGVSLWAFEYFGGMIIRNRIAQTHHIDINHRMRANPAAGINSDGLRCKYEATDFTVGTFNIIFLGDSFTYGERLKDGDDTFPAQLETLINQELPSLRARSVNFAWVSSSPLLSARLLKDVGAKYKPDLVVLCLDMTDFHDDLRYLMGPQYIGVSPIAYLLMRADLAPWVAQLHRRWALPDLWGSVTGQKPLMPRDRFFVVNQELGKSLEYMTACEANIRDVATFTTDRLHAQFLLVMLPRSFQYSDRESPRNWERYAYTPLGPWVHEPFKWLEALRARVNFPCTSLLDAFRTSNTFPTCFDDDPHWIRDGHTVAARGLFEILKREQFLKSAPSATENNR